MKKCCKEQLDEFAKKIKEMIKEGGYISRAESEPFWDKFNKLREEIK